MVPVTDSTCHDCPLCFYMYNYIFIVLMDSCDVLCGTKWTAVCPATLGCMLQAPSWTVIPFVQVADTVGVCYSLVFECTICFAAFAAGLVHIGHPHACAKTWKARF
jgi:hypothetical protein